MTSVQPRACGCRGTFHGWVSLASRLTLVGSVPRPPVSRASLFCSSWEDRSTAPCVPLLAPVQV
eukprot:1460242-Pyramimonas_sp.AAC.1